MRHFDPQDYCHETLDRCKSGHTLVLFDSRKLTDPRNSHVVVLFPISHLSTCHVKATWSEKLRLIIHTEGKTFCCSFYRIPDQPTVAWPMWVGAVRLSVMGTASFVSPSVHPFHSFILFVFGTIYSSSDDLQQIQVYYLQIWPVVLWKPKQNTLR